MTAPLPLTATELHFDAILSDCRTYRYALWRRWDVSKPDCAFIGLNPSTADERADDPTIRRCIGFARSWGFGGLAMLNLFAYRATDPRALYRVTDPVGPKNNDWIQAVIADAGRVVVAWGGHNDRAWRVRAGGVLRLLKLASIVPYCLGTTRSGSPRHPLYLRADTPIAPYGVGR